MSGLKKSEGVDALLEHVRQAQALAETLNYADKGSVREVAAALGSLRNTLVEHAGKFLCGPKPELSNRIEEIMAPQELQFMVDCLPHIQQAMFGTFEPWSELSFLDVGPRFGCGADLVARLHRGVGLGYKLNVESVDISDHWSPLVHLMFPDLPLTIADVGGLERTWDVVYCSGVIEHVVDTDEFLDKLLGATGKLLFVMAPYNENPILVPSHLHTITKKTFKKHKPKRIEIIKSNVWRPHDRKNYKMILATFKK